MWKCPRSFNESWKDEGGGLKAESENALRDRLAHQPVIAQTGMVAAKTAEYIAESVEFDIGDS